jgi:hypothetical protein
VAPVCASQSQAAISQHRPQQRRDAVDMQIIFTDMTRTVYGAIDSAGSQLRGVDPVQVGVDRTQTQQGGCANHSAEILPITLGTSEEAAYALPRTKRKGWRENTGQVSISGIKAPPIFGVMSPLLTNNSRAQTGLQECSISTVFATSLFDKNPDQKIREFS